MNACNRNLRSSTIVTNAAESELRLRSLCKRRNRGRNPRYIELTLLYGYIPFCLGTIQDIFSTGKEQPRSSAESGVHSLYIVFCVEVLAVAFFSASPCSISLTLLNLCNFCQLKHDDDILTPMVRWPDCWNCRWWVFPWEVERWYWCVTSRSRVPFNWHFSTGKKKKRVSSVLRVVGFRDRTQFRHEQSHLIPSAFIERGMFPFYKAPRPHFSFSALAQPPLFLSVSFFQKRFRPIQWRWQQQQEQSPSK